MKQVILIMVDTQRQDMLSCYDKNSMKTPAIDSIAEEGTLFQNAFTCQPVCGPARSAIFTGLYPHSNGMLANGMQLGANVKTAGQLLSSKGIECGYVGKWHLDGGDYFGYGKCPEGYNSKYWYDMRNFLEDGFSDEERKKSRVNMSSRFDDPDENNTYAHRCANRAIDFIDEFKDKDFFLTLSLDEPHDPSVCPKRFKDYLKKTKFKLKKSPNVKGRLKNKPEHHKVWARAYSMVPFAGLKYIFKGFFACNAFCDYEIGRVLQRVKETGIKPMIIYTSDHGEMLLSHKLMGKGPAMYNEITKIPFLIKGEGFDKGVSKTTVSHIDILPTIMSYLGITPPKILEGEALQNFDKDTKRDVLIEFNRFEVEGDGFMGFQPIRCITDGRYKLVINLLTSDEFYDMDNDPYEMKNLINDRSHAKIRDDMHDRLIERMNQSSDPFRGYYWYCRPWRKGSKASFSFTGYTRQPEEEDFTRLNYATGLPLTKYVRKKGIR